MKKRALLKVIILILVFIILLLGMELINHSGVDDNGSQVPNPAAVYCKEQGYRYEIKTKKDGSEYGICIFPDESKCDAWDYFYKCNLEGGARNKINYSDCEYECK